MSREVRNKAASIRARLARLAKQEGRDVDAVFLQYMQERLLYRLGCSRYADRFVLKGGLLLFGLHGPAGRPTKDIDFLGRVPRDEQYVATAFREIASISGDDGLVYYPDSVVVESTTGHGAYPGVSVRIECSLEQARKRLRLDIGFGDVIVPQPVRMHFPVLLDGPVPVVWASSLESVIAEKFEAMLRFSSVNSRLKDFYDVYWLSLHHIFDGRVLQEAIQETLARRGTPVHRDPPVLDPRFADDPTRARQWSAFLRRSGISSDLGFQAVMARVRTFLGPVFLAVCREEEYFGEWSPASGQWQGYQGEDAPGR